MDYDKMSKFEKYATIFIVACLLIVAAGFACKIANKRGYRSGWADAVASIQRDTLVVVDTIRIDRPVPEYVYIDREKPVYLPVHDTALVVIRDTTYIAVKREIKGYSGDDYRLEVSGVQPALDWIEVYPKLTTITEVVKEPVYPELLLSPSALIAFDPAGMMLGGGASADTWAGRWQFGVDIGYGLHVGPAGRIPGWYGRLNVKYNILRK